MSGGVGPCSDIRLPHEEQAHKQEQEHVSPSKIAPKSTYGRRGLFNFQQLNALAVAVVLSASGMISLEDFAFVIFSLFYVYFISRVAFPPHSHSSEPPVFGRKNKILTAYVFAGALIGLFLPIAYIFEGIFEGDKEGIKAAAPHVFLLASQIFMEGLILSGGFSVPIRVFVPIFYNAVRIFTLVEWLKAEISKVDALHSGSTKRLYIGRGLAIANFGFWCFNLFGFLVPVYLPKALTKYYSDDKGQGLKMN